MEQQLNAFQIKLILVASLVVAASVNLVNGQGSMPCTTNMISSFTPCANIITGSTNNNNNNNGLKPPTTCCDSLKSLMSTNMDCACMVLSANAPSFQLAIINQALALSLSRACNINGVPLQCKAYGSPLPAPGPAVLGPSGLTFPSIAPPPLSPQVSKMMVVAEAHKYENLQLAAAPAPVEAEAPTRVPEIRPILTPRPYTSDSSCVSLSQYAFVLIGIIVFGIY